MKKEFGDILSDSWKDYKNNFNIFLKSSIFLYLIPTILLITIVITFSFTILPQTEITPSTNTSEMTKNIIENSGFSLLGLFIIFSIVAITYFVFTFFFSLTIFYTTIYNKKNKMTFAQAFKGGAKYFWKLLGFLILLLLILFIVMIPMMISLVFAFAFPLLGILLIILFLIAGFILYTWVGVLWVFTPIIIFTEKIGLVSSMKKSWTLVKGKWWRTFGYLLLISLILTGINFLIQIAINLIQAPILMSSLFLNAQTTIIIGAIFIIISSFLTVLANIIGIPFLKNFYISLK